MFKKHNTPQIIITKIIKNIIKKITLKTKKQQKHDT